MKQLIFISLLIGLYACSSEPITPELDETVLADYLELNNDRVLSDLVACAGGAPGGLLESAAEPTDVFFYPIEGATDFRYFEAEDVADSLNFTQYREKELSNEPIFNGYLWKYNNVPFPGERMAVVTFKTPGRIHACTPIRMKTNVKPTENRPELGQVIENGVTPSFIWEDGSIPENVIYFQIISDEDENFISGTYTIDKNFTFYDLENVVFNITDTTTVPTLLPDRPYTFTFMGVSEDNWVNLYFEHEFRTD